MRRLVFSTAAQRDLRDVLIYLSRESGSVETARSFVERLRGQCRKLASLPGLLGRARPELGSSIRSFAFGTYVIFFVYEDDDFLVVGVLERHRDVEARFPS